MQLQKVIGPLCLHSEGFMSACSEEVYELNIVFYLKSGLPNFHIKVCLQVFGSATEYIKKEMHACFL